MLIVKELQVPIKVRALKALLRRIPASHPKRVLIEEELAIATAGYKGEQSMRYYIEHINEKYHHYYFNIRLPTVHNNTYFQIDLLLITPSYIASFESKNMQGTLTFDFQARQLIQKTQDEEIGYNDPIQQIARQEKQFKEWLTKRKLPIPPLLSTIVVTNPHSIIKFYPERIPTSLYQKVIKGDYLETKIASLDKKYVTELLTKNNINKLKRLLLKEHTPYIPNYMGKFQISEQHLIKGVQCPSCGATPMFRKKGVWICPSSTCQTKNENAHLVALEDYALLLRQTITNKELRDFLKIDSPTIAKKLLISLDLPYTGKTRGRIYTLPPLKD